MEKVLPHHWDGSGDVYKKEEYQDFLNQIKNEYIRFDQFHGHLEWEVVVEQLTREFEM